MAMKKKTLVITIVVLMSLLFIHNAYALTTHAVIRLTIKVVPTLALNLDDAGLNSGIEAEAFSELEESGIAVDKIERGDSTVWLFTKTE